MLSGFRRRRGPRRAVSSVAPICPRGALPWSGPDRHALVATPLVGDAHRALRATRHGQHRRHLVEPDLIAEEVLVGGLPGDEAGECLAHGLGRCLLYTSPSPRDGL